MMEFLDIVDEHDVPTGLYTTKQEAHKQGHIHRIAAVLVFLADGKLLAQRHKKYDRRLDHSVGGHVRSGESYLTAAKRETSEELGITTPLRHVDLVIPGLEHFERYDPLIRHNYGVYAANAPANWEFSQQEEAVDQLSEMPLDEIIALANDDPDKFTKGLLVSLGAYLRATESPLKIVAYGKDWSEV